MNVSNVSIVSSAMFRWLAGAVLLTATAIALAAEPPATQSAPSKETREKMATIHQNMAACLRSDKAFTECQQQMHQNCAAMMGEQGCPMGMGPNRRGMMPKQQQ